jgi:hypothetical protein
MIDRTVRGLLALTLCSNVIGAVVGLCLHRYVFMAVMLGGAVANAANLVALWSVRE